MDARDGSEFAALAAKIDELSQVCAKLSRENAELRARFSQLDASSGQGLDVSSGQGLDARSSQGTRAARSVRADAEAAAGPAAETATGPLHGNVSRRMIGKALGAAAVGVVGAAAVVQASAGPALANDGNPVVAGGVTRSESLTELKFDGSGNQGMLFLVNDTDFGANDLPHRAVLGGWAGGDEANGVYGLTLVDGGDGVVGEIGTDDGAANKAGNGVHGIAHTPGTTAVRGENSTVGGGVGIWGSHAGSGRGVYGTSVRGHGVIGTSDRGTGVKGIGPVGVVGQGSTRGGVFSGSAAQVQLSPGPKPTHPENGQRGDLYADSKGRLWFCKTGGNTATWHQIA
jgi:hypothetical protein